MLIEVLIFFLFRGSERIFRHLQTALHGILNISVQNLMKMHDFFLQTMSVAAWSSNQIIPDILKIGMDSHIP